MTKHTTLLLLPMLALTAACESRLTGNEGNFQFQYAADDRLLDFNKPLAVGARLDMAVVDVGALQPVELSAASSDDPSVLEVVAFAGNQLTIEGIGDGNALLEVTGTTAGGEELSDNVNFNARVPEVHKLFHTCGELGADTQGYLTGQTVYVPFEFEMANGQPVIGYGYYPVTASSSAVAPTPEWMGQQYMSFDTVSADTVVLSSDIDGTELTMEVVEAASIDGAAQPIAFVLEDIDVGDTNAFYVLPMVGDLTVCQANVDVELASDTPEICTVQKNDNPPLTASESQKYEFGWFEVTGVAEGTCTYTVTYPLGNGGEGASASFSYPIEP